MTPEDSSQTPPTEAELPNLASDVLYEYFMLNFTYKKCEETRGTDSFNAYLESFVVHTRCLTYFFVSKRSRDDVIATDYAPDWEAHPDQLKKLLELSSSTNKRIQHITAYRQRVPKSDDAKTMEEIREAVETLWKDFQKSIKPEYYQVLGNQRAVASSPRIRPWEVIATRVKSPPNL